MSILTLFITLFASLSETCAAHLWLLPLQHDCWRWGLPLLLLTACGRPPAEAVLSMWNQALTLSFQIIMPLKRRLTLNRSDSDLHSWYFFPQPSFSLADATQHCIRPVTLLFKVTERAFHGVWGTTGDLHNFLEIYKMVFFFSKSPRSHRIGHFLNDTSIEKVTGSVTTAK